MTLQFERNCPTINETVDAGRAIKQQLITIV